MLSRATLLFALRINCTSLIQKLDPEPVPVMYISSPMLDTLVKRNFVLTPEHMQYAARHGHLDMLQGLMDHGVPVDHIAGRAAVVCENLHIMQYLHSNGFKWEADICNLAVHASDVAVMAFLSEKGYPLPEGL